MPLHIPLTSKLQPQSASIGRLPPLVLLNSVQLRRKEKNAYRSSPPISSPSSFLSHNISTSSHSLHPLPLVFLLYVLFLFLLVFFSFFHISYFYIYSSFDILFPLFRFKFLTSFSIYPFLVSFINLQTCGICLYPH